jgi:hypothetical protein
MRQSCQSLLEEYQKNRPQEKGTKLKFSGVEGYDVYNITAPFKQDGRWLIVARVEPRESEHSRVQFFRAKDDLWVLCSDLPSFVLQDPFITKIADELIFGGVEISPHPTKPGALTWQTNFYRGKNVQDLTKFAVGPPGMKDIRLVQLPTGQIAVFTRPQGEVGGRGTIGFLLIQDLSELTSENILQAQLLEQFSPEEWGGANEVHVLENGLLGVLGHIACFDEKGDRHYYAMTFAYDVQTRKPSPMKLLATRADFPSGPAKRPDLQDVIFSGGLKRLPGGQAEFYAGVSDAEAHYITVDDPFLEYENWEVKHD